MQQQSKLLTYDKRTVMSKNKSRQLFFLPRGHHRYKLSATKMTNQKEQLKLASRSNKSILSKSISDSIKKKNNTKMFIKTKRIYLTRGLPAFVQINTIDTRTYRHVMKIQRKLISPSKCGANDSRYLKLSNNDKHVFRKV